MHGRGRTSPSWHVRTGDRFPRESMPLSLVTNNLILRAINALIIYLLIVDSGRAVGDQEPVRSTDPQTVTGRSTAPLASDPEEPTTTLDRSAARKIT